MQGKPAPQEEARAAQAPVSVAIPAYNEETTVGETVRAAAAIPGVMEVWVVDDGSDDGTAAAALAAGAKVIRLKNNVGKGGALNAVAPYLQGRTILLLDADVGSTAGEGVKLLKPLWLGEADLVVGRLRSPASDDAVGREEMAGLGPGKGAAEKRPGPGFAAGRTARRAGKGGGLGLARGLARWGVEHLTGQRISAVLSGQRAMWRCVWEELLPFPPGYGVEVAATVRALRLGYRLVEVDVNMGHKVTGNDWSGFCHRSRQFLHVGLALWACRQERGGARSSCFR